MYNNHRQGRKSHSGGFYELCHARGKARAGAYLRNYFDRQSFYDDEDNLIFHWIPRGKLITTANEMIDYEFFAYRARHSTGWKEHKCRHQWEHNVREKEKHQKNRDRKAVRRGEFGF